MAITPNKIPNGVYFKISKDITGWTTIVGPDVILVKNGRVKLIYFHVEGNDDYNLNEFNQLLNGRDSLEDRKSLEYIKGRNLSLISKSTLFNYIQLIDKSNTLTKDGVEANLYGAWFSSNSGSELDFERQKDIHTKEHLLRYKNGKISREGRWSIFEVEEFLFLEFRIVDSIEKHLMPLLEVSKSEVKCYSIDADGLNKTIVLKHS